MAREIKNKFNPERRIEKEKDNNKKEDEFRQWLASYQRERRIIDHGEELDSNRSLIDDDRDEI